MDISNLPPIPNGFKLKDSGSSTATASKLPPIPDGFKLQGGDSQGESGDDWMSKSFPKSRRDSLSKSMSGKIDMRKDTQGINTQEGFQDLMGIASNPIGSVSKAITGKTLAENIGGDKPTEPFSLGRAKQAFGEAVENAGNMAIGGGVLKSKIGQTGGTLLKPIIDISGKAIKSVSKFIPETIKRGAADYLTKDVTGKVTKIFQDAVTKFTPEIVNFSRKIGIPESAISTMKKYGTQAVEQLKGSGDALYQRITKGLETKDKEVSDAYAKAFQGKDDLTIPIPKSASAMKELLLKAKYIDKDGNITEYAKNDITENSALRKILNFYKSSLPEKLPDSVILDATEKPIPADPSTKQFEGTNGFQWRTFRDELSKLRRSNKGLSREISKISDAMHSDAENAGFKGLSNARDLARKNFEAEDKFMTNTDNVKALFGENGVGKYHTMTGEQKRSVQELSKYIGDNNLVSDIEKHSASKYLDKIMEGKSEDDFRTLIQQAYKDKDYMSVTEKKLSDLIGYKNAKEVMKEISTKRNIENVKKGAKYVGGTAAGLAGADAIYETGKKVFGG